MKGCQEMTCQIDGGDIAALKILLNFDPIGRSQNSNGFTKRAPSRAPRGAIADEINLRDAIIRVCRQEQRKIVTAEGL